MILSWEYRCICNTKGHSSACFDYNEARKAEREHIMDMLTKTAKRLTAPDQFTNENGVRAGHLLGLVEMLENGDLDRLIREFHGS